MHPKCYFLRRGLRCIIYIFLGQFNSLEAFISALLFLPLGYIQDKVSLPYLYLVSFWYKVVILDRKRKYVCPSFIGEHDKNVSVEYNMVQIL